MALMVTALTPSLGAQKADVSGADISPALKLMDANRAQIESTQFAATAGALVGSADSRDGALEVLQQCTASACPHCLCSFSSPCSHVARV